MGKDCIEFALLRAALKNVVRESVNLDSMFKNVIQVSGNSVCDDHILSKIPSIDAMIRVKYLSGALIAVDICGEDAAHFNLVPFLYEMKDKMKRRFPYLEVVTEYDSDSVDALDAILEYSPRN